MIKRLQQLVEESGHDLDIALVHQVEGYFAFDMFPHVDIFMYPGEDHAPKVEGEVAVIAICNEELVYDHTTEEPSPSERRHLKLITPDAEA